MSVLPVTFWIYWPVSAKFNQIGKDLKGVRFAQACEKQQEREEKSKLGLPAGRKGSNVSPTRLLDIRESTQERPPQATKLHEFCCSQNSCLFRCCKACEIPSGIPAHKSHLTHQSWESRLGSAPTPAWREEPLCPVFEGALTLSCLSLQVLILTLTQPGCLQQGHWLHHLSAGSPLIPFLQFPVGNIHVSLRSVKFVGKESKSILA